MFALWPIAHYLLVCWHVPYVRTDACLQLFAASMLAFIGSYPRLSGMVQGWDLHFFGLVVHHVSVVIRWYTGC